MRPLDPRLLRYASAARWFLVIGAVLGLAQTLVVVVFSWLLSQVITLAVGGHDVTELGPYVGGIAAVVVLRAALVWLLEVAASRGAASVKSQLRTRVLRGVAERGPDWLAGQQGARVSTLATQGLDALDNYFARYLPQLLLAGIATPILVLVMLWQDLPSGITVIIVLPLIPLFMVLIGQATQAVQKQQWESLQRLGTGFLDLVGGLGTLKIFGRERRQTERVRTITEDYRARTMKVLRVSFLSGFVLELGASLSVALVAVSIGLRLVDGSLGLGVGLFVLLLAPEAFLPVRQIGVQFHAAADGLAAAEEVFLIIEGGPAAGTAMETADSAKTADAADAAAPAVPASVTTPTGSLRFDAVTVRRGTTVTLAAFSATLAPGRLAVIAGPSGAGKSTLVATLQGFVPYSGSITLGETAVVPGGPRPWLAWAGQRPGLLSGTIADNVALGAPGVDQALVARALDLAGGGDLDPGTALGVNGDGLSGGQAQRVAAARAIYRTLADRCPVLVLDEPSSALDEAAEGRLIAGLRELAAAGTIVIVVSHRPAVVAAADLVLQVVPVSEVPASAVSLGEDAHV
ncbi:MULTISPECIES: thiol reductant ABC exporter subunit CydD [unclassified Cryobacterium]|uniref:thiol reductant ABC exporter subunit CydD n=1 Tax=unclassified Cryobacterium TaxID=2649013 RepID=UPI002AB38657|nr:MULTISPECIES: thiol reductant ABC exporter subunit CydD [unclassified Cryobacterium]MDY7527574.1 thiol reductant ABC exporter subunit CydD [Cryobacterium sp. 10C2]MEB0001645.1 thiol reductant ABC exporter subunit CydD [Cryobacterium sp. RTC2.1]MEB0201963.1 thiol reductant ABC exporter subunit CydD [Cryobacterium sp. 5I3]MEB0286911.1 thiol reductant ABC exporter subunit CydD [Cryobacterium sp. 10S3]MEB0291563.1 thiol reductant ABC exporter subunit CydD [Cryobacterium sp. 10C2]